MQSRATDLSNGTVKTSAAAAIPLPGPGASVHLVGVCGAGMAPLALVLRARGCRVSGEDKFWPEEIATMLNAAGVQRLSNGDLPPEVALVVHSSAVSLQHPTCRAAAARAIPTIRRGEALAALVQDRRLIAVVGSHGKTSTTAMLITALRRAGIACDYVLGAMFADGHTPPAAWTGAPWVVAEIDESDGTIAHFAPEVTLCVNIDWDHCDLYRDPAAIECAFAGLAARTRQAIFFNAGCETSRRVFGNLGEGLEVHQFGVGGDYALTETGSTEDGIQTLRLARRFPAHSARVAALGEFNAINATAALAVTAWLGATSLRELLAEYPGVRRRQARLAARPAVTVLEDYAHHPAEIEALLRAVRSAKPGRLIAIFQPHRFTRTAQFKTDFARVLAAADRVFLLDVYAASEAPVAGGTSADVLAEMHKRDHAPATDLLPDARSAPARIVEEIRDGDWLLFIGAGDIDAVARATAALLADQDDGDPFTRSLQQELSSETVVRRNEPLGPKTTIRVGGVAEVYAEPANTADLQALLAAAHRAQLPVTLLGRGSNMIVPDEGVRGLVIRLTHPHWRRLTQLGPGRFWAGAGLRLRELCGTACQLGEGGFEFLEGIPGTIGGALRMNAGAMGGWMFELVESVHYLTSDGTLQIRSREELHVEYRCCRELQTGIALGAVLRTRGATDAAAIRARLVELQTQRTASQPREPSAGCIFKNPPGESAGRIIDELGLKGLRIGDAEVSPRHANFIVNRGHATGADVIALVRKVRDEVWERRHIELEPEVLLCGRDWREVLR